MKVSQAITNFMDFRKGFHLIGFFGFWYQVSRAGA